MQKYQKSFEKYLKDLSQRRPSPGGGSVAVLSLCLGASLIEKAVNYSSGKKISLNKQAGILSKLKKETVPLIDLDGEIFKKFIEAKGKEKIYFLRKSDSVIIKVGQACGKVFELAKGVESDMKKSIISDFYIGLELVKVSLRGCVFNLEANSVFFGKKNKYIRIFKDKLTRES